jgi:hypothetical protein
MTMRYILVQKKMQHPESDGFVSGKEALRSWWKDALNVYPV